MKFLDDVNWKLLSQQKLVLLELLDSDRLTTKEKESIDGLINLLDHIQDEAEVLGFPVSFLTEDD
jgi:hypothetical protein